MKVSEQLAGKAVKCPKCGKPVRVPARAPAGAAAPPTKAPAAAVKAPASAPTNPPAPAAAGADTISVTCAGCQKKLTVRTTAAGKAVKCPGCGKPVKVPAQSAPPAEEGEVELELEDAPKKPSPGAVQAKASAAKPSGAMFPKKTAGAEGDEGADVSKDDAKRGKRAPASTEDWEQFEILKQPQFMLKRLKPGFVFKQWPPKKKYLVCEVEGGKPLARGFEKRHWLWVFLRSLTPFWVNFQEENGPPLFKVRVYGFPLPNFQFFDSQGGLIVWFKAYMRIPMGRMGGYWVYDSSDQQIGELKAMNQKWDTLDPWSHWALLNNAGEELVQIIDEVKDAAKRKGGSSGWVKNPGGVIRFPTKRPADAYLKLLGLAAAMALEADDIALAPPT
jgi:ribosomal protein S27E